MIKKSTSFFVLVLLILLLVSVSSTKQAGSAKNDDKSLIGFINAKDERSLESRFDSYLNAKEMDDWMKRLSARPHNLGSAYDKENAEFILSLYKSWGFDANIEEFSSLFPTPKTRLLELTEPTKFTASLAETPLNEDPTSGQTTEQLPTYNAYSIDGDVTATLVYVNYGIPKDYEELEQRGIDVKGKIVIARYGGSWRGIKPKVAAEHGAIGCIIYSDPKDDGYGEGDVYPKGAYRNESGVQRGSVADMPLYPGDPSTPFVGATKGVKHQSVKESKTITKIPVLPISYGDALPFLRSLTGQVVPDNWRGSLPITYHFGPGPATVHLKLEFNWNIVPVYDVIAKLAGSERPDEWIIRGNHHDAWVNGAEDPLSGQVALLEEAKAVGKLASGGWKPKRTIVYAAWDGEEPGLIGSTEWVETHADLLKKNAAVYLNTDATGRGFFGAAGSHTLEKFINEVARDVVDPETKLSVEERARAERIVNSNGEDRKEAQDQNDLRIGALGSGSDYTPFLQHLGIASLNLGYGGENGGGSYHSIYDSYAHFTRFKDPGFVYEVVLAQTGGRTMLRLANSDVLPFEFESFSATVGKYLKEVTKLLDDMRDETAEANKMLSDKSYEAAADPTETYVAPKPKDPVPFLSFAPIQNAIASLRQSSKEYDHLVEGLNKQGITSSASAQKKLDQLLIHSERALTRNEGLPRRPWFVHQIYAPGFYTGYGVKTLPGIREAIEQRNWKEASDYVEIVAGVLDRFRQDIDDAKSIIKEISPDRSENSK